MFKRPNSRVSMQFARHHCTGAGTAVAEADQVAGVVVAKRSKAL
jgi:hypothetical protein